MERLESKIPSTWLQKRVIVFADDFHMASLLTSEEELLRTLEYFGIVLVELKHGLLT